MIGIELTKPCGELVNNALKQRTVTECNFGQRSTPTTVISNKAE